MTHYIETNPLRLSLDVSEESQAQHVDQGDLETESTDDSSAGGSAGGQEPDDEPTTIGTEEPEPLPKDVAFDILKNQRRRLVLRYVIDHENPVTIGTLAEHVAAVENDKEVMALNSRERKRAYVGLYQCHLPRMHDAGVLDFDQNRGTVSLGVHAEELVGHLETESDQGDAYPWLYAALSTVGAGAFLISQSSLGGAGIFGTFVVGLVIAAFLATATWQLYSEQYAEGTAGLGGLRNWLTGVEATATVDD